MQHQTRRLAVGLAAWSGLTAALAFSTTSAVAKPNPPADKSKPFGPSETTCANHGTSVEFVDTPKDAAALAKRDQKLVFVLHVSGHFEDARFT